jgi:hypothetical protein
MGAAEVGELVDPVQFLRFQGEGRGVLNHPAVVIGPLRQGPGAEGIGVLPLELEMFGIGP